MTGPIQFATQARPRQDLLLPERDEHVWIATVAYRLSPETCRAAENGDQLNLDKENLAVIEVGCFVCEQPWSTRLSYRKCTGEPAP
jgi:hypothetical protein